jgi:CO/xanthine dehydrogenase FAD-binding subunit
MILRPDELVARIRLPRRGDGWTDYYRKVGTRRAQAISKVCLAAAMLRQGDRMTDVRIALGSVAPTVIRCFQTEQILRNEPGNLEAAKSVLRSEIAPIDDIRSNANYRLRVAGNLLEEFLFPSRGNLAATPL